MTKITKVTTFLTAPEGIDLVVVRVDTSQPGLYGHGCATFTQRASAVAEVVDRYLGPLVVGRDASMIEDLWRVMTAGSYWRNGPVTNNAVSGIDMALWDIAAKSAGVPLYKLFGGRCRDHVDVYAHADGSSIEALIERVQAYVESGYRYVRCQLGGYGGAGAMQHPGNAESAGSGSTVRRSVAGPLVRPVPLDDRVPIDPANYMNMTVAMLHAVRSAVGPQLNLLHDVHERVPPSEMPRFARAVDDVGLFFLEDPIPPDQYGWLPAIRRASVTPIALGELFTTPEQWMPLLEQRLIDYIRVHISHIGGITPARKLAAVCEAYGIRTAWHGPGDCTPVGHAANVHLDFAAANFGIQEFYQPTPVIADVFPGMLRVKNGAFDPPELPGIGVDFDSAAAARFPPALVPPRWTRTRAPDGTLIWP